MEKENTTKRVLTKIVVRDAIDIVLAGLIVVLLVSGFNILSVIAFTYLFA